MCVRCGGVLDSVGDVFGGDTEFTILRIWPRVRSFIYGLILLSDGENLQEANCHQRTESWRGGLEWDIVTSSLLASLLLPGCHEVSRPLLLHTPFMMPLQTQKQWANPLQTETPN